MADFNKPDLNSTKSAFPGEVRDIVAAAAKLDYSADTNVPDGVIKYNRSTDRLQEKTGGSFVDAPISNLKNPLAENIKFDTGYTAGTPSSSISATGTNQGGAASMGGNAIVQVTSATLSSAEGVILPSPVAYDQRRVVNRSGITIKVYPASGHAINSAGTNNPITIGNGESREFYAHSTTQWYCQQPTPKTLISAWWQQPSTGGGTNQGMDILDGNSVSSSQRIYMPMPGQLTHLSLALRVSTASQNIACNVFKNGSTASSSLTLTSGVLGTAGPLSAAVSFAAGDYIELKITYTALAAARELWAHLWGWFEG